MPSDSVQTFRQIKATFDAAGLKPRRRFGQHFLIDGNLMRRLVLEAELDPGDLILEVGGGTGGLTDLLAGRVAQLLCVELDRNLHTILKERFKDSSGVTLLQGDILRTKHELMPEVASRLRSSKDAIAGSVKLVANLPYQIAAPLVMNLLVDYPQVRRLCFTVQAEVGQRITAKPGGKDFGPLSVLSQTLSTPRIIARLPPQAFWPRPAVHSVMMRLDVQTSPFGDPETVRRFASLVRGTFDHRRKTLRAALSYVIDPSQQERVCRQVDATRRPETFSIDEWVNIFHLVSK